MSNRPSQHWPVVIIGAGPAGGAAALRLARAGIAVLLLDRAVFPRDKVCGCCLNGRAVAQLEQLGVARPLGLNARPRLQQLVVHCNGQRSTCALPNGYAVSRRELDDAIVRAAIEAGATFRDGVCATVTTDRSDSHVQIDAGAERIRASVVVVADGLGGSSLREHQHMQPLRGRPQRLGIAAHVPCPADFPDHVIHMQCAAHGYVGLVRLDRERLDCAAAVDPAWMRRMNGPRHAVQRLISDAGGPTVELERAGWRGIGPLSQRRAAVSDERLFVIGDAGGYIEPFTGEGIAWSLESAERLEPLVIEATRHWRPDLAREWQTMHGTTVGRSHRRCRVITAGLRSAVGRRAAITLMNMAPRLAACMVRRISMPGETRREMPA